MDATSQKAPGRTRRWIASMALVASGLAVGGVLAGTQLAQAASTSGTGTQSSTPQDPAKMSHGPGETLLTGSTADRVETAALAKVSGGSIVRVETDSAGSAYEAHVRKSDGTFVTVKVDRNFNVTDVEDGFGGGPTTPASGPSN
jgi:hypothetical protein